MAMTRNENSDIEFFDGVMPDDENGARVHDYPIPRHLYPLYRPFDVPDEPFRPAYNWITGNGENDFPGMDDDRNLWWRRFVENSYSYDSEDEVDPRFVQENREQE